MAQLIIAGGRNTRVEWRGAQVIGSNASSYNFGSIDFGQISPRRHIIVAFQAGMLALAGSHPLCTGIGGVTPSLVLTNPSGLSAAGWRQLWIAPVPTNASMAIAVSRNASMTHGLVEVWAAYDLVSAAPHDTLIGSSGNPSSGSLDTLAGGIAVGFADTTAAGSFTWGGLTRDHEAAGSGTAVNVRYSGASKSKTAAGTLAVSSQQAATHALVAASFR